MTLSIHWYQKVPTSQSSRFLSICLVISSVPFAHPGILSFTIKKVLTASFVIFAWLLTSASGDYQWRKTRMMHFARLGLRTERRHWRNLRSTKTQFLIMKQLIWWLRFQVPPKMWEECWAQSMLARRKKIERCSQSYSVVFVTWGDRVLLYVGGTKQMMIQPWEVRLILILCS